MVLPFEISFHLKDSIVVRGCKKLRNYALRAGVCQGLGAECIGGEVEPEVSFGGNVFTD